MEREYAEYLLRKTRENYNITADEFSRTREKPWEEVSFLFSDYLKEGDNVLDLGCGNGRYFEFFKSKKTKYIGLDNSEKLIEIAKKKYGDNNFITADALNLPFTDNSFDKVYSLAILHHFPSKELRNQFLTQIKRVLKPGGRIGIIENRQDSLSLLREAGIWVMQQYPRYIRYIMILPFRLPKNKDALERLFHQAGLKALESWEGEVEFHFKNGSEVLEWSLHTGASAGFDRIMDPAIRDKCDACFIEFLDKNRKEKDVMVTHRFTAGIAQKL